MEKLENAIRKVLFGTNLMLEVMLRPIFATKTARRPTWSTWIPRPAAEKLCKQPCEKLPRGQPRKRYTLQILFFDVSTSGYPGIRQCRKNAERISWNRQPCIELQRGYARKYVNRQRAHLAHRKRAGSTKVLVNPRPITRIPPVQIILRLLFLPPLRSRLRHPAL